MPFGSPPEAEGGSRHEEIATAAHYDPVEALAAVAEFTLSGDPG